MVRNWLYLILSLAITACSSGPQLRALKSLDNPGPVHLELKPSLGFSDSTEYRSRTLTKTFSNSDLTKKIQEDVEFTVDTEVSDIDAKNSKATYKMTTTAKEGKSDLADFAMPELGDSLEYIFTGDAKVLKAGDYPPGTIFFVPPISLPKGEVHIGDTWPMSAEWISLKSGIPLKMELVSILKSMRDCGASGPCAEIQVSGDISIMGSSASNLSSASNKLDDIKMRFHSEIQGQLIFSIDHGLVLYSILRSEEKLAAEKDTVEISSCMLSQVIKPTSHRLTLANTKNCDPNSAIPQLQ